MNQQINNEEEKEILSTVRLLSKLMISRDTSAMENILDVNYTLTHMTGYVQPKNDWFKEVVAETMKYYSAKELSNTIDIKNDRGTVVVRNLVDARIWGSRNIWRLQQKITLQKRNGKWIILSSVASTF